MSALTVYVVYRRLPTARIEQPISRTFTTLAQAKRYVEGLPLDWAVEIREIPAEAA